MTLGEIQESDALVLQAIIKATVPKLIIEFGFFRGFSAKKMLEVMSEDSKLISVDILNTKKLNDERHVYIKKDMSTITETEFKQFGKFDMVFFDAGHDFEISKKTFLNISKSLKKESIIVVHDTGMWNCDLYDNANFGYYIKELNARVHRPDEQEFCKFLESRGFNVVHLHSSNELRHGISIAQRRKLL